MSNIRFLDSIQFFANQLFSLLIAIYLWNLQQCCLFGRFGIENNNFRPHQMYEMQAIATDDPGRLSLCLLREQAVQ